MAVREFELESALRSIQGNSVSPYDAYVLGMMKAQSPQDFKQNLDSLNSLKQLVSQFNIPQHDNTALLQALLKDDIHSLLRTLSKYLLRSQVSTYQPVQPVQSVSVLSVRPASPVHSVVSTMAQNNSQSQARTIPSSSLQTSIPAIYSQVVSSQSALPTHQSVSYSRPSQPSNPSVTQMLKCERCNSMNPINDGLIRCSCGNRYCHMCHQETLTCICNAALVRRIQAKNS